MAKFWLPKVTSSNLFIGFANINGNSALVAASKLSSAAIDAERKQLPGVVVVKLYPPLKSRTLQPTAVPSLTLSVISPYPEKLIKLGVRF